MPDCAYPTLRSRVAAAIGALCIIMAQAVPVIAQQAGSPLPENLNLGSARRTAEAPQSLSGPITIVNGGREREVTVGMRLTPAQALAVQQVLQSGTQSIILGVRGNAIGGSADLSGVRNIASLTVPKGVSVIQDFGSSSTLDLTGNLVNSGAIYAVSTNATVSNAIVSANNIRNNVGALITSVLPGGGLPGVINAIDNLSLSLVAADSIFNSGTISSANHLNLVAGNQIVNAAPSNVGSSALSALGTVNIVTQSLANSGVIQAASNINVAQQLIRNAEASALSAQLSSMQTGFSALNEVRNLFVNNTGGVMEALGSAIDFDHASAVQGTGLMVVGGVLLSSTLKANAGGGGLRLTADHIPGIVTAKGGSAIMGSLSGDLSLGDVTIDGDPTFFSTNSINIVGDVKANEKITIVSGKDIIYQGTRTISRQSGTQGFDIALIAGAEFQVSGDSTPLAGAPFGAPFPSELDEGATIKVVGPSADGGSINQFDLSSSLNIDASSAGIAESGGNVLLAAYHGDGGGQGLINVAGIITTSGGAGQSTAGNVTIIAPNSIAVTQILMGNGKGAAQLTVTTAQPKGSITALSDGSIKGALSPGSRNDSAGITVGHIINRGGSVLLDASGTLTTTGGAISVTAAMDAGAGGTIDLIGNSISLGSTEISANGGLASAFGSDGGKGGKINITARVGNISDTEPVIIMSQGGIGAAGLSGPENGGKGGKGGAGGAGGKINITAAGDITLDESAAISITAEAGPGGEGGMGGEGVSVPAASKAGTGGAGGKGGNAGKAGSVTITADGSVTLAPIIASVGAQGGVGGTGGIGGNAPNAIAAGNGGSGGKAGKSSGGGKITITANGQLNLNRVDTAGGSGGEGGVGGLGGNSQTGTHGNGGTGGTASAGGKGGNIAIASQTSGVTVFLSVQSDGGLSTGGALGGKGGGLLQTGIGGNGGNSGNSGSGGGGGKISLKAAAGQTISIIGPTGVTANGEDGAWGTQGGTGGTVLAGTGGSGGKGSNGGNGGNGGSISFSPNTGATASAMRGVGGLGSTGGPGGSPGGQIGPPGDKAGKPGKPGKITGLVDASSELENDGTAAWKRSKRRVSALRTAVGSDSYRPVNFAQPVLMFSGRELRMQNLLLAPDRKDVTAEAGPARLHIGRGAVAFVVNNGRDVSVLCLHDNATGDVTVKVGNQDIELRAGEHLVVTESTTLSFADVNPLQAISCRELREHALGGGQRAFFSQFSLVSALYNLKCLRQLAQSSDHHERAVHSKIVKNAAILHMVTAGKGSYKTWRRSELSAGVL